LGSGKCRQNLPGAGSKTNVVAFTLKNQQMESRYSPTADGIKIQPDSTIET